MYYHKKNVLSLSYTHNITCVCIIYVCGHLTKGQKALIYFLIMMAFIQIVEQTMYQSVSVQRGDKKTHSNLNRKRLIQIITKFDVELPKRIKIISKNAVMAE